MKTVKNTVFLIVMHIVRREPDVSEEYIVSLYLQGRGESQVRNWLTQLGFLLGSILDPEGGRDIFFRNIRFLLNRWRCIPESRTVHSYRCEYVKSDIYKYAW
jgi:hypothetical protein